jgi:hypothetical protein
MDEVGEGDVWTTSWASPPDDWDMFVCLKDFICLTVLLVEYTYLVNTLRGSRKRSTQDKILRTQFQLSKRIVLGSLVVVKDTDFVGRSEAETP